MSNRKEVVKFIGAGARCGHAELLATSDRAALLACRGHRGFQLKPREKKTWRARDRRHALQGECSHTETNVPLPRDRFHGSLSFAKCSDHRV
jgi:hypothetical protein